MLSYVMLPYNLPVVTFGLLVFYTMMIYTNVQFYHMMNNESYAQDSCHDPDFLCMNLTTTYES